jgi:hypothetical protein
MGARVTKRSILRIRIGVKEMTNSVNTLSRKDIRMLLHLIEHGEEAITEYRNEYETEVWRKETEDKVRRRLRRIRIVLFIMSESAKE